jgi:hypothetical protein
MWYWHTDGVIGHETLDRYIWPNATCLKALLTVIIVTLFLLL